MNLSTNEIVAYIGAAAWLPQIVTWVYRLVTKPEIIILPNNTIQIGYTSYGPIFNINLALASRRKDAIVDHICVHLIHEDGSRHTLSWAGMSESLSSLIDPLGNRHVTEKEYATIALKITASNLVERFFRFQDDHYHIEHNRLTMIAGNQRRYLESNFSDDMSKLMTSKEIHDLREFYSSNFWWKSGKYKVKFEIGALENTVLKSEAYSFTLSKLDIDSLKNNIDVINNELENVVMDVVEGFQPHTVSWSWRHLQLLPDK